MSFVSTIGDAVGGAADKVAGNSLVGKLGEMAAGLAGGAAAAGALPPGEPKYLAGEVLDPRVGQPQGLAMQSEAVGSDSAGPVSDNHTDAPQPIEFVHYARIHTDMSDNFNGGDPAHGLAFRDALLREAVLLHGFVASAQDVLRENQASKGAASQALETVGSLLGGAKKEADLGPEAFEPLIAKIQAAIKPINAGSFTYEQVHKAGVDLNEARASFAALCKTALKPGGGGGMKMPSLSALPGVSALGPVADIVGMIPDYLFKVQDLYLAMFRNAREKYEAGIETVCDRLSIDAISKRFKPPYDAWFVKSGQTTAGNGDMPPGDTGLLDDSVHTDLGSRPDVLSGVKRDEREFEQDQARRVNELMSNLDTAAQTADDMQAKPQLLAAIAVLATGKPPAAAPPPRANQAQASGEQSHTLMGQAITEVIPPTPGFICSFAGLMSEVSMEILQQLYPHLLATRGEGDLRAVVQLSTRSALSKKLVDYVWKLFKDMLGLQETAGANQSAQPLGAKDLRDRAVSAVSQPGNLLGDAKSFAQGALANKAADMAKQLLTENSKPINAIIDFVAGDLADKLLEARKRSMSNGALTMESYLGYLPMLHAAMVRNLVFPVFHLILDLFGIADVVAAGAWNPVKKGIDTGAGVVGDANRYTQNAIGAAQNTKERMQSLDEELTELLDHNDVGVGGGADNEAVKEKFEDFGDHAKALPTDAIKDLTQPGDPAAGGAANAAAAKAGPLGAARVVAGAPVKVSRGHIVAADSYDSQHKVLVSAGVA